MKYRNIIVECDSGVATIILNRPKVLNALNRELFQEFDSAITNLEHDESIRVVIVTGSGQKAFSAGGDIKEMVRLADGDDLPPPDPNSNQFGWHLATCQKPTIGAINGLAYGGGALMASSFDIRVGCENTSFRFLAASYGRVNSTWNLPMQVGWPVAKELLLTARVVGAEEAYRIGLLNHIVPSTDLLDKAMELAKQIASNDTRIVRGIKELMIENVGVAWQQMYRNEIDAQSGKMAPTPIQEGFSEFLARKKIDKK